MSEGTTGHMTTLLLLLANIRAAIGDPTGRFMQDELVAHCRKLKRDRDALLMSCKQLISEYDNPVPCSAMKVTALLNMRAAIEQAEREGQ